MAPVEPARVAEPVAVPETTAPPTAAPPAAAVQAPPPQSASQAPLEPPPPTELPQRPSSLHTEEAVRAAEAERGEREWARWRPIDAEIERAAAKAVPEDFAVTSSPWIDFTLTSFWMNERVGSFLNLGAQFGGYFFNRLRLSARLVVPLEEVHDDFDTYDSFASSPNGDGGFSPVDSANVSALYSASAGLILGATRSFVFAPGVLVQRTDVSDYGTSVALQLPFEWTTRRNLRVGFELALGHAFGGKVVRPCYAPSGSCGQDELERPGKSSFLLQFHMGWALGRL